MIRARPERKGMPGSVAPHDELEPELEARRVTVLVAALATFMALMDAQIVNVALPTITRTFDSTTSSAQWVISAYALGLAAAMPASGWFGDRFGSRSVITCATVAFTGASALCAAAPSLPLLISARALQSLGGGMLIPVTLASMYRAHPPAQRISAATTMTTISMVAPATAPLIGGLILTQASWRWIFLINVPVGLLLLWLARKLGDYRGRSDNELDVAGLVLGVGGITMVLYAVTAGPTDGWGRPVILICAVTGLTMLVCFARTEIRRRAPLLNIRLLARERIFRVCCLIQLLQPIVFLGSLVYTSLYVQDILGFSPLASGSATFPEALGIWCFSRVVRRLYRRTGPRRLVGAGFSIYIVGTVLLSQLGTGASLWAVRCLTFILGVGTAFVSLPIRTAAYSHVEHGETGHATAIFSTSQRLGQAIGVALLSAVLAVAAGGAVHPDARSFSVVYLTAAAVAVLGLLVTVRIPDSEAASTMRAAPV